MFVIYYYQYHSRIYSHFVYRTGDSQLAEDLTSDVFVKAYEAFDRYDRERKFSTWIYTIARNTLHDYWRRHQSESLNAYYEDFHADLPDEDAEEIWEATEQQLDHDMLMQGMRDLSPVQQSCIVMKYLDGLSNSEISQILELSEANVRQHLSRGTRKMKTLLAPYYEDKD